VSDVGSSGGETDREPPPPPAAPPPPPYPGPPPPAAPPPSGYGAAPPPAAPPPSGYGAAPPPAAPYGYGATQPVDNQGRPLAGWWLRFGAIFLDSLILNIPAFVLSRVFVSHHSGQLYGGRHLAGGLIVIGLIFTLVDLAYFSLLSGSERGQTVGQMAFGIAVRDEATGGPIGPQRAGLRILALVPGMILDWVPILGFLAVLYSIVAGLSPLWDRRRQGFHDKATHTFVIKVR